MSLTERRNRALAELEIGLELADEIGEEVVDAFSGLHPGVVMNLRQWDELKEMISRYIRGLPIL